MSLLNFHLGYFSVGAVFFGRSMLACAALERLPFLSTPPLAPKPETLDVILLARGAVAEVEQSIDGLRAQERVQLRIVLVDDRSDPTKAAALQALAGEDLSVVRIDSVPTDVLPFPHALAIALAACDRPWVLVLQEPVLPLRRDSVAAALHTAKQGRAASQWILARPRAGLLWPVALGGLGDALPALAAIHRDRESLALPMDVALHRLDVLRAAMARPGAPLAAVPELLIADTCRRRHLKLRVAHGADDFAGLHPVRLADLIEASERSLASVGLRPLLLMVVTVLYALAFGTAVMGCFSTNPWGWFAAGGWASAAIPGVLLVRVQRGPLLAGLLTPLAALLEVLTLAFVSTRLAILRGTRWRGVFVPLTALRRTPASFDGDQEPGA